MSLRYDTASASTFVIIHGGDDKDYKDLISWLELMKESAGHPLLMVALFFELHHRRLRDFHDYLKRLYIQQDEEAFAEESKAALSHRNQIKQAINLHESLLDVESELLALRSIFSRLLTSINFVQKHAPADMKSYIRSHGATMTDRLLILRSQIEILHVKCTNVRESVSTLTSAMWNLVTLWESKISQQISVASKRDSTIMMVIAIGTMLFLPIQQWLLSLLCLSFLGTFRRATE